MGSRESFGIHDPAYRVGRAELLSWVNDLLDIQYTKVEQCANGAAYCQIFDAIYPGDVPMKRVSFEAKQEHDSVKNYKVLQGVFIKRQINKNIEVEKLVKAKPLDNLEFLQWCKRFFDLNYGGQEYDAVERRAGTSLPVLLRSCYAMSAPKRASPAVPRVAARGTGGAAGTVAGPGTVPKRYGAPGRQESSPAMLSRGGGAAGRPISAARAGAGGAAGAGAGGDSQRERQLQRERDELEGECRRMREESDELQLTVDTLEKERDFYFHKLREIEVLCLQVQEGKEPEEALMSKAMAILYATDDAADPPDGEVMEQFDGGEVEEGGGPEEEPEEC